MLRFFSVLLLLCSAGAAHAERRVALVIGEDGYRSVRALANAAADAQSIDKTLASLGFEVTLETNRDLRRMRRALDDFRDDGKGADVALVFFAGHGVEISGDNRLLPTDADASSLDALKASTLPLEEVREAVSSVAKVGLIILDACRNDPFGTGSGEASAAGSGRGVVAIAPDKEVKPGLGRIGRAEGILFAFSAAPGETASDGADGHSPFAEALAKYLGTDGIEVRSALTLVQQEVYDKSRGKQLPYVESGLPRLFFAATATDRLPERERLLLAMADVTPDIRAEVEEIAAQKDMPLAPLYGALISSDAVGLSAGERTTKLQEAAAAFVRVRDEMRTLSSDDPQVARLRDEAQNQLALGAFDAARAKLAEAAAIDSNSRQKLKANYVERTVSEAATDYLSGGAARASLDYAQAIAGYEKAVGLFDELEGEDIAAADRFQQTETLTDLAETYEIVGNLGAATRAYEARHRVSVGQLQSQPDDPFWQREVALSNSRLGDVLVAQGKLAEARASYEEARVAHEALAKARPGDIEPHRDLAVIYSKLAYVVRSQGSLEEALSYYSTAQKISEIIADVTPADLVVQRDLGIGHDDIGDVLMMQGDVDGALKSYEAGHAIWVRITDAAPDNAGWQADLMISDTKIGDVRRALNDPQGALEPYQDALAIGRRLVSGDPANTDAQRDLAVADDNIGDLYITLDDYKAAVGAYADGNEIWRRLVATDQLNTRWRRDLVVSYTKIGDGRLALGDPGKALEAFEASLANVAQLTDTDPTNVLWQRDLFICREKIGDARLVQGNLAGARQSYEDGQTVLERLVASDPANAMWQRDRILIYLRMAKAGADPRTNLGKALEIALDMQARGILAPADAAMPGLLRDELAKLQNAAK